jgi:hypothetical protein
MKKKNLQLEKKLTLNKETLINLSQEQLGSLAGGAPVTRVTCARECVTFATIRPGEQFCRPCEATTDARS